MVRGQVYPSLAVRRPARAPSHLPGHPRTEGRLGTSTVRSGEQPPPLKQASIPAPTSTRFSATHGQPLAGARSCGGTRYGWWRLPRGLSRCRSFGSRGFDRGSSVAAGVVASGREPEDVAGAAEEVAARTGPASIGLLRR